MNTILYLVIGWGTFVPNIPPCYSRPIERHATVFSHQDINFNPETTAWLTRSEFINYLNTTFPKKSDNTRMKEYLEPLWRMPMNFQLEYLKRLGLDLIYPDKNIDHNQFLAFIDSVSMAVMQLETQLFNQHLKDDKNTDLVDFFSFANHSRSEFGRNQPTRYGINFLPRENLYSNHLETSHYPVKNFINNSTGKLHKLRDMPYEFYSEDAFKSRTDPNYQATTEDMKTRDPLIERDKRSLSFSNGTAQVGDYILKNSTLQAIKSQVDEYYLIGYDCSRPSSITPVSSIIKHECVPPVAPNPEIVEQNQYQILQESKNRRFKAKTCTSVVTRTTFYCGAYDHITPLPHRGFYNRQQPVSADKCDEYHRTLVHTDPNGGQHTLAIGSKTTIAYYTYGTTYISVGDLYTEIKCTGAQTIIGGTPVPNMVQYEEISITLRTEEIVLREDDSVVAFYDNVRLPCSLNMNACTTGATVYTWDHNEDPDYCPLKVAKTFRGAEVKSGDSTESVITSLDGNSLRIVVGSATIKCGKSVLQTNYNGLYLYALNHVDGKPKIDKFSGELRASDINLNTFVSNRDETLYYKIKTELREEFRSVWTHDCLQRLKSTKLDHYVSRELPGYYTFSLGGNAFLTKAGELTFRYACKPVLTKAIVTPYCYDALAVELKLRKDEVGPVGWTNTTSFYLEPLTHRLTKVAAEVPCTQGLYSSYQDLLGRWFAITPEIRPIEDPEELNVRPEDVYEEGYDQSNFGPNAGLFDGQAVGEMMNKMDFQRTRDAVLTKMSIQTQGLGAHGPMTPAMVFPAYALPGGSWHNYILGKVGGFFRSFGETAAVLIALRIIFSWIWRATRSVLKCYHIYQEQGLGVNLLWALCLDILLYKIMRATNALREGERADTRYPERTTTPADGSSGSGHYRPASETSRLHPMDIIYDQPKMGVGANSKMYPHLVRSKLSMESLSSTPRYYIHNNPDYVKEATAPMTAIYDCSKSLVSIDRGDDRQIKSLNNKNKGFHDNRKDDENSFDKKSDC